MKSENDRATVCFRAGDENSRAHGSSDKVGEFAVVGKLVNHEVGLLPCFKRAGLRAEAKTVGGVDSCSGESFRGRQAHLQAGQRQHEGHRWDWRGAGIEVGGEDDGQAGIGMVRAGGYWVRLRAKTDPGRRTGWTRHRAAQKSLFGDGFEMVGGRGPIRGEGCAGAWTELLGVDADSELVLLRSGEDGAAFVDGEGVVVAKGVAESRQLSPTTSGMNSSATKRT